MSPRAFDWRGARARIVRDHVELVEDVEFWWVLPLDLAPTLNRLAEMKRWQRGKLKAAALGLMRLQSVSEKHALRPLPGRPLVRCVRFSSREPDQDAAWPKVPVDRLTPKAQGLGVIQDDKPAAADIRAEWRRAPPGAGLVWVGAGTSSP